jgi:hypothetical protein
MGSLSMMRAIWPRDHLPAPPKTTYTTGPVDCVERTEAEAEAEAEVQNFIQHSLWLCLEGGRKDGATSEKKILCPLL